MNQYLTIIHNRNYTEWSFFIDDKSKQTPINLPISPLDQKLFSKDIIRYHDETSFSLIHSEVRSGISYAGILLLEQNKTFGRNQSNKRLLYKCIPDDKHLPAFLIPYEVKLGFNKKLKNKFVIFKFHHWDNQHPYGILTETLGDIDQLPIFYEYQLYCKSLHISLTDFTNNARDQLKKRSEEEYIQQIIKNPNFHIEDRRNIPNIFTIDPENSNDFDDAISITTLDNNTYKISIYIANVYFWLETLNLWKSFSKRVSTIYLPDKKRPMLPSILSDNLCSLQEGQPRFAFAIDYIINASGEIISHEFHNVVINVSKNYRYEEHKLIYDNSEYKFLLDITNKMDNTISDSHDVIAFWMIKMNSVCGEYLASKKIGIFRQASFTKTITDLPNISSLDPNTKRIIQMWNNIAGQYIIYDDNIEIHHDIMKCSNYIHITSPIRRIVDILNQMWMSISLGFIENISSNANEFLQYWLTNISFMNISMRSIRKIQTDCNVLHKCFTDNTIMQNIHKGIIFDKMQNNNGTFSYVVYLTELKLLSRLKTYSEYDNYMTHSFKLFLFENEQSMKKKIRVQIVE